MTDTPTPIRTAREMAVAVRAMLQDRQDAYRANGEPVILEWALTGAIRGVEALLARIAEPPPDERHAELRERITAWIREADGPPELDDDVVVRHAVRAYSLLCDCRDALGGTTDGK